MIGVGTSSEGRLLPMAVERKHRDAVAEGRAFHRLRLPMPSKKPDATTPTYCSTAGSRASMSGTVLVVEQFHGGDIRRILWGLTQRSSGTRRLAARGAFMIEAEWLACTDSRLVLKE